MVPITTESIWFSFTMLLFIGPGNVYNYFGRGYNSKEINQSKTTSCSFIKVKVIQSRENQIEAALKTEGYKHLHRSFASKKNIHTVNSFDLKYVHNILLKLSLFILYLYTFLLNYNQPFELKPI